MELYEILEMAMVLSFGASWPISVLKSYKMRTTKGKSLPFLLLIFFGYVCGVAGKLLSPGYKWYVLFFYVMNLTMVGTDIVLYARNYRLDKKNGLL